jgi:hypothetical protein
MGWKFNQAITLPQNLTTLVVGCYFNQAIMLPKSIVNVDVHDEKQHLLFV